MPNKRWGDRSPRVPAAHFADDVPGSDEGRLAGDDFEQDHAEAEDVALGCHVVGCLVFWVQIALSINRFNKQFCEWGGIRVEMISMRKQSMQSIDRPES